MVYVDNIISLLLIPPTSSTTPLPTQFQVLSNFFSFFSSPLSKKKQKTNKTLKIKTEKQKKKLNKIDF